MADRTLSKVACPWCSRQIGQHLNGRLVRHNNPTVHYQGTRGSFHRCDGSGYWPESFKPGPCSCGYISLPLPVVA